MVRAQLVRHEDHDALGAARQATHDQGAQGLGIVSRPGGEQRPGALDHDAARRSEQGAAQQVVTEPRAVQLGVVRIVAAELEAALLGGGQDAPQSRLPEVALLAAQHHGRRQGSLGAQGRGQGALLLLGVRVTGLALRRGHQAAP